MTAKRDENSSSSSTTQKTERSSNNSGIIGPFTSKFVAAIELLTVLTTIMTTTMMTMTMRMTTTTTSNTMKGLVVRSYVMLHLRSSSFTSLSAFRVMHRHQHPQRQFRASSSSTSPSPSSTMFSTTWKPTRLGLVPSAEEFLQERRSVANAGTSNSRNDTITLSYLTDVEGDKAYLDRYVELSKVLMFVETSKKREDEDGDEDADNDTLDLPYEFPYSRKIEFVDDNSMLVFGGDLWDKGGRDLYVARQLLDLKRRHPSRVIWVLGNRDINKLRILQELGLPGQLPTPYHPGLKWFRGSGKIGDPHGPLPSNDPAERLIWILSQTMGSPDAFEHRRNELHWERRGCPELDHEDSPHDHASSPCTVNDIDVVESYRRSCHPTGEMGLFLQQAHLAARIGPVLIVHGSIPLTQEVMDRANEKSESVWDPENLSTFLPWLSSEEKKEIQINSIEEWMDVLNQFCHDSVEQWKNYIDTIEKEEIESLKPQDAVWAYRAGYKNGPPGSALIQYGMGRLPNGEKNPGVVYNSFTPEGWPASFAAQTLMSKCTREFFERSCVELILTGHKPQGDSPSPIRIDDQSWIIAADTSYSGDTNWWDGEGGPPVRRSNLGRGNSVSFRGDVCVAEVVVRLTDYGKTLKSIKYHGVLSDGHKYESLNLLDPDCRKMSIGQVAPHEMVPSQVDSPHQGKWWTKSVFSDGSHLFHAGEGFSVWNLMRRTNN